MSQKQYNFSITTTNNTFVTKDNWFLLGNLTSGSPYNISVVTVGVMGYKSTSVTTVNYTKPETVQPTISGHSNSSITVTWTKPKGNVESYSLYLTPNTTIQSLNSLTASYQFANLSAGRAYSVMLTTISGPFNASSELVTYATIPNPPGPIEILSKTTSSIETQWTEAPLMTGAKFYYLLTYTSSQQSNNINTTNTSWNFSSLSSGTSYNISVTTVGELGFQSETVHIYMVTTKPAVVKNLTFTGFTTTSVSVNWTKPNGGVDWYIIQWNGTQQVSNRTNETFFTIPGLTPGTPYNISVAAAAVQQSNEGDKSSISTFTRPEKPGNISVTQGTNTLSISWILPRGNISYYQVNISNENLVFTNSSRTVATTTNFTYLKPGRLYNITVTAFAGNFWSTSDQVSFATVPKPPGSIIFSRQSNSSLQLQWATPDEMSRAPDIIYSIAYQAVGGPSQNTTSTQNNTLLSLLDSGTNYTVTVKTIGPGNLSSTVVQNSSFTLPNPVRNLIVSPESTTSLNVNWLNPLGVKSYYRYLVDTYNDTGGLIYSTNITNNSTTVPNLNPGTNYSVTVRTKAAEGSESTVEKAFSYTIPEAVSNITAVGTTTSLSVSWTLVTGKVSSYSVVLNSAGQLVNRTVNNQTTNTVFGGLTPGVIYCVQLITKSGPYESNSSLVCNATFPNPPGSITVKSQTVNSINFTWALPQNMRHNQYNFSVTTTNNTFVTKDNWFLLGNLPSGSPYNISVVTVGVMGYKSTSVTTVNYTRPFPVSNLTQTEITTNAVTLVWKQQESKLSYSYWVQVTNESNVIVNELNVKITNATIINLRSGSNFNFTVTTLTADGTQADPGTVSYFTRPYNITELKAETINTTAINLNWMKTAEYKDDYKYRVATSGCAYKNDTLRQKTIQISGLNPGTNCTFCVSVMAANGIEGQTVCTSQYTKPETVQPTISGHSNSSITVKWTKPKGNVERYSLYLTPNTTIQSLNSLTASYQFANLSAGRAYSVVLTTISGPFNASSELVTNAT
uniref:Fibronectin type-III domain-containing protein n=2 Tax=Oreochromis aureus TaxID=47969 RepID=A0AAZ1Y1N2_OREAU